MLSVQGENAKCLGINLEGNFLGYGVSAKYFCASAHPTFSAKIAQRRNVC